MRILRTMRPMPTVTRSRFVDLAPSGVPLETTERDVEILRLFLEFPYLSAPYVGELLGYQPKPAICGGKTIFRYPYLRKRLTRLRKDGGYLKCPAESWRAANSRYRPAVYTLTEKGKALLRQHGVHDAAPSLGNDFAHAFGTCLVMASIRIGLHRRSCLRFITPREILDHPACPESTRTAPDPFAIPTRFEYRGRSGGTVQADTHKEHDWAPFGIAHALGGGRERKILFPGIEFDRRTEPLESDRADRASVTRHLLAILALLDGGYRQHFGLQSVYVPIITIGEVRKRSIQRLLLKLTGGQGSERILLKSTTDFASWEAPPPATDHMLSVPWDRAWHPPFDVLNVLGVSYPDESEPLLPAGPSGPGLADAAVASAG